MCSVLIAAIALAAMFATFSNGCAILRVARDDERATQILMQKTEAIRLMTWYNLSNCPTTFVDSFNPTGLTNGTQGTVYYGTISLFGDPTNIPSSVTYRTNIHLITISLVWTNTVNATVTGHTRQAQTMLAAQGMETYLYGYGP